MRGQPAPDSIAGRPALPSPLIRRAALAYFFPGTWVNGELPTATAGFGFSAFGLRISLLLRA